MVADLWHAGEQQQQQQQPVLQLNRRRMTSLCCLCKATVALLRAKLAVS
jgi:hypothetical protein